MKHRSGVAPFISFLLFQMAFVSVDYIPWYNSARNVCMAIVGLFLLVHSKGNQTGAIQAQKVKIALILYLGTVLFLSYLNRGNIQTRNSFFSAAVYCGILFEVYFAMKYFAAHNQLTQVINTYYFLAIFYVILTDAIIFLKPDLFIAFQGGYLIGNKFTVSYFHLFLATLFKLRCRITQRSRSHEAIGTLLLLCFAFVIAASVHCTTGMVGTIFLFLMFHLPEKILCKPTAFFIVMGISAIILFIYSNMLLNPLIRHFITNVLHKDITLTGRMVIYRSIGPVMQGHWLLGYGFGSSYEICVKTLHFANSQNGVLNFIMEQGIISFVLFIFLVIAIFRYMQHCKEKKSIAFPIVALLYVYALLGSVEITLGQIFMVLLLMLPTVCLAEQFQNSADTGIADNVVLKKGQEEDGYESGGENKRYCTGVQCGKVFKRMH